MYSDIQLVNLPFKSLLLNTKGGAIWHALYLRYCRFIAPNYDIRITASRTIGWGLPAIHFLSDVVWNKELNEQYGEKLSSKNPIKRLFNTTGKWIAGKSLHELHPRDVFVANSIWTAEISKPYTTNQPLVIYPAVVNSFIKILWQNRKTEFVCFGRISPEKKIEDAIDIIESVRSLGHNIGLTIYGQFENNDYSDRIKELVRDEAWIKVPGPIYGDEKSKILPTFKYGINTCQREAFGISTAEMINAGIIPFIPKQGAQYEIVSTDDLVYANKADAVSKIINIIGSEEMQTVQINRLNIQKQKFSASRFKHEILQLLTSIL